MAESVESCSFCGRHKNDVAKLIVNESVAICNQCVDLCQELLTDTTKDVKPASIDMDPRSLKTFLDQYVIGQEQAKKNISVAIINHVKRMNRKKDDPEIAKANILLVGPTGSGKTLLAKTVARYLDVPFVIADATSLTEAGYVGDDVEMLISRLYAVSGNDVEKTQKGIVFVDEVDKISRKGESASITRDVSGEGVQQALLKLVEGTTCRIPTAGNRRHPAADYIEIDTSEILFIAGGAFVGVDSLIKSRVQGSSMGFAAVIASSTAPDLSQLTSDDLIKFGLIPEFVGRFPNIVTLAALTQQDMMAVLTEVKNNYITQYQWIFQQDGVELEITVPALEAIVDLAMCSRTGARSLQGHLEKVLMPHMFELAGYRSLGIDRVVIGADQVNNPTPLEDAI